MNFTSVKNMIMTIKTISEGKYPLCSYRMLNPKSTFDLVFLTFQKLEVQVV